MEYATPLLDKGDHRQEFGPYDVWEAPALPMFSLAEPYTARRAIHRQKENRDDSLMKPIIHALFPR